MKQDKVSFNHINIGNLFISYKLHKWSRYLNIDYAPGDCLFGAIKLTKILILINMDIGVLLLDLIDVQNFHCQMELVKAFLFLVQVLVHQDTLTSQENIS